MSIQPYIRMSCALIDAASGACARGTTSGRLIMAGTPNDEKLAGFGLRTSCAVTETGRIGSLRRARALGKAHAPKTRLRSPRTVSIAGELHDTLLQGYLSARFRYTQLSAA